MMTLEMATLSGTCVVVMEAVFQHIRGVKRTLVGYAGGHTAFPCYDDVLAGATGHSCVVQVVYDSTCVSYATLLDVFFMLQYEAQNPLQLQPLPCPMPQHQAKIFYHNAMQQQLASHALASQQRRFSDAALLQIVPASEFYPSEEHWQSFYKENRQNQYSVEVIAPQIQMARNFIKSQMAAVA